MINTRRDGDSTGIALAGELDLRSTNELNAVIQGVEESDVGRIVIDLADVSFIDSTGLSVLLGAKKRSDGRLIFVPSKHDAVRRLLELTGTVEMFD